LFAYPWLFGEFSVLFHIQKSDKNSRCGSLDERIHLFCASSGGLVHRVAVTSSVIQSLPVTGHRLNPVSLRKANLSHYCASWNHELGTTMRSLSLAHEPRSIHNLYVSRLWSACNNITVTVACHWKGRNDAYDRSYLPRSLNTTLIPDQKFFIAELRCMYGYCWITCWQYPEYSSNLNTPKPRLDRCLRIHVTSDLINFQQKSRRRR